MTFTPLAAIAPAVVAGIDTAEQIPGATGEQKKALVMQIVAIGAQGANAQAGRVVVDPAEATAAAATAIDTIVHTVNVIHTSSTPAAAIAPAI